MDVYKLLVVGDPKVGKTSLIQSFLELPTDEHLPHSSQMPRLSVKQQSSMDFVLKIINIKDKGVKARIQLWDLAGVAPNGGEGTTLPPLFIRNAVGCVIVARSDRPQTVENALKWKQNFDQATHMPDTQPLPACLFVNHFTELPISPKSRAIDNEISTFHVNSMTTENVLESFTSFITMIIEDIERNKRTDEGKIDEMWDESIKMRTYTNAAARSSQRAQLATEHALIPIQQMQQPIIPGSTNASTNFKQSKVINPYQLQMEEGRSDSVGSTRLRAASLKREKQDKNKCKC